MQSRTRLGHLLLRRQRFGFPCLSSPAARSSDCGGLSCALTEAKKRCPAPYLVHVPPSPAFTSTAAASEKLHVSKDDGGSGEVRRPWGYFPLGAGAATVVLLTAAVAASSEGENGYVMSGEELKVRLSTWMALVTNALGSLKETFVLGFQGVLEAGSATVVLIQLLAAVLFQVGDAAADGLNAWWRPRVAALIADLSAHGNRRKAVVDAGNGRVLDWLLHSVTHSSSVQNEAARALAYLLQDEGTREVVLGRPQALPHLLRFAASLHADTGGSKEARKSRSRNELSRGRSMLVAALMDVITSSCEEAGAEPALKLSGEATRGDIGSALRVLRKECPLLHDETREEHSYVPDHKWMKKGGQQRHGGSVTFGLWDDLRGPQVAVPLAAWALGAWAQASLSNRRKIGDLDKDGDALLAALDAPERTVKWHAALAIRLLLRGEESCLNAIAHKFCDTLLATAAQAGKVQDSTLAAATVYALHSCASRNSMAHEVLLEKGLPVLRELAKETDVRNPVQVPLAQTLDTLTSGGRGLSVEESKKWSGILLRWVCSRDSQRDTRSAASNILSRVVDILGPSGIPISQAWVAMLLMDLVDDRRISALQAKNKATKEEKAVVQSQVVQTATNAATQLAKLVAQEAAATQAAAEGPDRSNEELPVADLLGLDALSSSANSTMKSSLPKVTYLEAATAIVKSIKALTELSAESSAYQCRIVEAGGLCLLRRLLLGNDYDVWAAAEIDQPSESVQPETAHDSAVNPGKKKAKGAEKVVVKAPLTAQVRKQAVRLLSILALQPAGSQLIAGDVRLYSWLQDCADGQIAETGDLKIRSYARTALLNASHVDQLKEKPSFSGEDGDAPIVESPVSRFEDMVFLMYPESAYWKHLSCRGGCGQKQVAHVSPSLTLAGSKYSTSSSEQVFISEEEEASAEQPVMDVVFIHGLCGGPFKTWRVSDDKTSTTDKIGLVETIDQDAGKEGTCWPREWLSQDLPNSRLLTLKYKTNLSQWSGATLPLQEVSSMLLDKLLAAGVGERPTVFVTHSMGGLVVKQMLMQASQDKKRAHLVPRTSGIVFYSCPHFGSKLADMPWRMGYVLRPAPTIGELRSGSPRLEELNRYVRMLHNKNNMEVLSFSETKVTPLVEGYGGLALRMEVVPIESAYPGYGDLVVLDGTDHVNSCKPLSRSDPAYTKTLEFLQKLEGSSYKSNG